jgi:hypothetical protein
MSPLDYLKRYKALTVPVVRNDELAGSETVTLDKYVLVSGENEHGTTWYDPHGGNLAETDALGGALRDYFLRTKNASVTVYLALDDGTSEFAKFTDWRDLWYYAQKPFLGKGSPEEVQITLQLADRFSRLKGGAMQAYCDTFLGLDCNGFVGNYLVHGLRGADWDAEPRGTDYLAGRKIDTYAAWDQSQFTTLDALVPANSYIMGMTGASGRVIPQFEGSTVGHIFITNPLLKWESLYTGGNRPARTVPTMWAVESTGGIGLIIATCQFVDVSSDGIFTVKRNSHPNDPPLPFRAARAA